MLFYRRAFVDAGLARLVRFRGGVAARIAASVILTINILQRYLLVDIEKHYCRRRGVLFILNYHIIITRIINHTLIFDAKRWNLNWDYK